jgi:hypothetical protein
MIVSNAHEASLPARTLNLDIREEPLLASA